MEMMPYKVILEGSFSPIEGFACPKEQVSKLGGLQEEPEDFGRFFEEIHAILMRAFQAHSAS
jgi:hypothetical protein